MTNTISDIQKMEDAGITSERVVFGCVGCGRDTVVHVGIRTFQRDKVCVRCKALGRVSGIATPDSTRRGMHGRRISDPELRARRAAKAMRTAQHKRNAGKARPSCASYGCEHNKHRASFKGTSSVMTKFRR